MPSDDSAFAHVFLRDGRPSRLLSVTLDLQSKALGTVHLPLSKPLHYLTFPFSLESIERQRIGMEPKENMAASAISPEMLQSIYEQLERQMSARFTAQIESQNETIAQLNRSLAQQREATGEQNASTEGEVFTLPLRDDTRRPKERTPTLRTFGGKRTEWEDWFLAANVKLQIDGEAIGNTYQQFLYLTSRLEGEAAKMARNTIRDAIALQRGNASEFLSYLNGIYGDANQQRRALQTLGTIRQKDRESIANYLPRFEVVLANAGLAASFGTNDDDKDRVRIAFLENSLNSEMRNALIPFSLDPPTQYTQFTKTLLALGGALANLRTTHDYRLTRTNRREARQTSPKNERRGSDEMEWTRTNRLNTATSSKKRAKWVDPSILQDRRERNLCLRCGKDGHRIRDCVYLPARNPTSSQNEETQMTKVVSRKERVEEITDTESSGGSEDSGKE